MDFYSENKKWILILTLVIVVIIFIAFLKNTFYKTNNEIKKEIPIVSSITSGHMYKGGLHNYTGSIMLPTPCYILSVDAMVKETFPEDVSIRFTITEDKKNELCAQVVTEKKFRIIFQASKEAKVSATVNNIQVPLNIEKETIDE